MLFRPLNTALFAFRLLSALTTAAQRVARLRFRDMQATAHKVVKRYARRLRFGFQAGVVGVGDVGAVFSGCKIDPTLPMRTIPKSDGHITMHGSMHWSERRRFTLAEYKRFGSYPDQFQFTDWSNGVMRIGNSVPPLFMRAIAKHLKEEVLGKINITFNPSLPLNRQTTDEM